MGDGYCDDETNNEACNFDGGDCCGDIVYTDFCWDCFCFEKEKGTYSHVSNNLTLCVDLRITWTYRLLTFLASLSP